MIIAAGVMAQPSKIDVLKPDLDIKQVGREEIALHSRHFTIESGRDVQSVAGGSQSRYFILQFDKIPDKAQRQLLEARGITLLEYVPNRAWIASVDSKGMGMPGFPLGIKAAKLLREDKISRAVRDGNYLVSIDGLVNVSVAIFTDADLEDAVEILTEYGDVLDVYPSGHSLKFRTSEDTIEDIADVEVVKWITVVDKEMRMFNDGNRRNTGVDKIQIVPYDLLGTGVTVAQWDGGWIDTGHDDFTGRLVIGDSGCTETECGTANHATHVGGTMLGDGSRSAAFGGDLFQWRGMAPNASAVSYEWWNDISELNNEYSSAINTYNAQISQNSWGYTYTNCGADCFGGYDGPSAELDEVVRGSQGHRILIVWSAGNERPSDCDGSGVDCIGIPGAAKNVLTVGATNSDDDSITSFSSFGPTNDGRLKPEVVAPGCEEDRNDGTVTGSVYSTTLSNAYGGLCGTSMAAPTVSGVAAILTEQFGNSVYFPSTSKAMLAHTAKDLGHQGPDFAFGYGRINVVDAVDLALGNYGNDSGYVEDIVDDGGLNAIQVNVGLGQDELKITLAWDDFPASAFADPALVNDLDLTLVDPFGAVYYPWVLDPKNPSAAAGRGVDTLNNMEQVLVSYPANGSWQIRVNGSSVAQGPQNYSLVYSIRQIPRLEPYLIDPVTDVTVGQNKFFTFSTGVRCVGGDCGNVSATLDPAAIHCSMPPCVASSAMIMSRDNLNVGEPNQPL